MIKYTNSQILVCIVVIFIAVVQSIAFGQNSNMASDIFNSKMLIIPNTVQNFVIF